IAMNAMSVLLSQNATRRSIQRGEDYFSDGAVGTLIRRGDELEADVEGTESDPYRVWVQFEDDEVSDTGCTCPYDYGGWCKHIVAVLLAYDQHPNQVVIRPPLATQLATLDREQLLALVLELADQTARLNETIDAILPDITRIAPVESAASMVSTVSTASTTLPVPPIPPELVNAQALRQGVRNAISAHGDWDNDSGNDDYGTIHDIVELAKQAQPALDAGAGRMALAVLETVTDEFSNHWQILDERGEDPGDFFDKTQSLWSEALLDPDLSAEERQHWVERLEDWEVDFDETVTPRLQLLQTAVRQGWDDPTLCAILRGEETSEGLWGDATPPYDQRVRIAQARLRILEQTGQPEAYLNLAKAEQQYGDYALKLLQLDRVPEAITAGLELPLSDGGMLELAKALYQRGEIEAAFRVAEHGAQRPGNLGPKGAMLTDRARESGEFGLYGARFQSELASWLRDRAAEHGQIERALAAGLIAFRIAPSVAAYLRVEALAGVNWPEARQPLLDVLRQETRVRSDVKIDIFLRENLIDDAIATLERHYASPETLARVMDGAIKHRPEWVIAQARKLAEPIMDEAKAAHYEEAAQWLRKAKLAYAALGQQAQWRDYLDALRNKHQRKYKLTPLLKAL
ncbi:MAG: SWIM zinc finger family protein, partial [Candidatus Contendobacter sp.]|nr:SWIM zinc finger family protein [Candidatus Contendobacter sp.]